jgi:hypothetical protein
MTDPRPQAADADLQHTIVGEPSLQLDPRDVGFLRHLSAQRLVLGRKLRLRPPDLWAVTAPVARRRPSALSIYDTLSRNIGAAKSTPNPWSTAAITRSRRSCEQAPPMTLPSADPTGAQNHDRRSNGIPLDSVRPYQAVEKESWRRSLRQVSGFAKVGPAGSGRQILLLDFDSIGLVGRPVAQR